MIRLNYNLGLYCIFLLTFAYATSYAQSGPQTIVDKEKKIQFTVPSGWSVTDKDFGYILGPYQTEGFILIQVEDYTNLNDLKNAMSNGITQEDGSVLTTMDPLTDLGSRGVAGMYEGEVDNESVRGFLMALMPPSKSRAAISIIVAPATHFNQSHIDELKALVRSIIFL